MPDIKVTLTRLRKVVSYQQNEATVVLTEADIAAFAERNWLEVDDVDTDELIQLACELHPVADDAWETVEDDVTLMDTEGEVEPHIILDVLRCPSDPTRAYAWVGSAETIDGARDLLPPVISCEEDEQHPGHWDAFTQGGGLYVIVPTGSEWAPAHVIGRPSPSCA